MVGSQSLLKLCLWYSSWDGWRKLLCVNKGCRMEVQWNGWTLILQHLLHSMGKVG